MTVLKWLLVVVAVVYACGPAVLFFLQRSLLVSIPPIGRIAPEAAGLPEAEERFLTTADGEKVIVWHVPANPGHAVILYFPGNGDFMLGASDPAIPIRFGERLFALAHEPKRFVRFPEGGHDNLDILVQSIRRKASPTHQRADGHHYLAHSPSPS
jgi:fermentation-respiration switch protein FrsA (DUF1100 family)